MPFVFFVWFSWYGSGYCCPDHWWILFLSVLIEYLVARSLVRLSWSIFETQGNILKDWRRTVRFRIEELSHSADNRCIHSFIHSWILPFIHSFIHGSSLSFIHAFIHSWILPFIYLFILSFIHSFIDPPFYSCIHYIHLFT